MRPRTGLSAWQCRVAVPVPPLSSSPGPCTHCPPSAGSNVGNREAGCQGRATETGCEENGNIPGARVEARPRG